VARQIFGFRAPIFDFEVLTEVQVLHERLLSGLPDMLLVASDGDYWFPVLAQLPHGRLQFGAPQRCPECSARPRQHVRMSLDLRSA
jgi:hypothetical protein